jgi:paraquat-inducible protein A
LRIWQRISILAQAKILASPPGSDEGRGLLIRCHDCDLLQRVGPVPPEGSAKCPRCEATLFGCKPHGFERAFVLYLAALLLLLIANAFPFLTLKVQGQTQSSHLISGAIDLYRQGMPEIAVAVVLFVVVFPLLKIFIGVAVVGPLTFGLRLLGAHGLYRIFDLLHPWAMMEIFLLGVLVAYTKLIDLATVELGPSLIAFVGLILAMIAADAAVDPHDVWERLRRAPRVPAPDVRERPELVGCHSCQLVCRLPASAREEAHCPRCGSPLHRRKPNSIDKTWALLITAALLYIPANVYPVMTFESLGQGAPSTIIGGVKELIAANMWPLALIVFVASILVPVLKLICLAYLLISVRRRSRWRLKDRTLIYRIVEAVGRWSMVDVFVVSILVALVRLGSIASIVPDVGIVAFASVVVLTMIAALVFDPRLMWDAAGANDER